MIVRGYLTCGECDHPHIVRIGMGQENEQRHQFPCRSCREPIEVGLKVDYKNISTEVIYGTNAVVSKANQGTVVNLDANFLIPESDQGKEFAFSRLEQSAAMIEKIIADRRANGLPDFPSLPTGAGAEVGKRPEFAAEWGDLRAAWSLRRNGKLDLSRRRVEKASAERYVSDPLRDLEDWIFRFVSLLGGAKYQKLFEAAAAQIKLAKLSAGFEDFAVGYGAEISRQHGRVYFDIMKSYFGNFDKFAQLQFIVTSGVEFLEAKAASSSFDKVKMFYGNAFEALSTTVEFFAYLNNLICARNFDQFSSMDKDKYLSLDKASRFRCFEQNDALHAVCVEADNTLRNASHHGGLAFDEATQTITYRAGKGGQGDEQQISYTDYLRRCCEIFMEALVILRLELVFAENAEVRAPL